MDRSVYFYIEDAIWVVSIFLPDRVSMKVGEHVFLEIDTEKPNTYYNDHKKKYPPGLAKKINQTNGRKRERNKYMQLAKK